MKQHPPLNSAPMEVQLAVDLIYLLESHNIEPDIALKAVELVSTDLKRKLANRQDGSLAHAQGHDLGSADS